MTIVQLKKGDYALMELDEGQTKDLNIRGNAKSLAYVTSTDATFALKQQHVSNTFLIVTKSVGNQVDMTENEDVMEATLTKSAIYIMERIKPDFSQVRQHMPRYGTESPKAKTLNELSDVVLCSNNEMQHNLQSIDAMLLNDVYYLVPNDQVYMTMTMMLIDVRIISDSFENVIISELQANSNEFKQDEKLFNYTLNRFSSTPFPCFDFSKPLPLDLVSFDLHKIAKFIAIQILREFDNLSMQAFMGKWKEKIDDILGIGVLKADFSMLWGNAIINDNSFVEYISINDLPFQPVERLKILFSKKNRWPVDDLKMFLEPVTVDPSALIIKYTKSFHDDGIRVCTLNKALVY